MLFVDEPPARVRNSNHNNVVDCVYVLGCTSLLSDVSNTRSHLPLNSQALIPISTQDPEGSDSKKYTSKNTQENCSHRQCRNAGKYSDTHIRGSKENHSDKVQRTGVTK